MLKKDEALFKAYEGILREETPIYNNQTNKPLLKRILNKLIQQVTLFQFYIDEDVSLPTKKFRQEADMRALRKEIDYLYAVISKAKEDWFESHIRKLMMQWKVSQNELEDINLDNFDCTDQEVCL